MYLGGSVRVGGFGPWRRAINQLESRQPRWIVAGHTNRMRDDAADQTTAATRTYLDDAEELLRIESTAAGFFTAKLERYPSHVGRTVLWAGARALYGVREDPDGDVGQIMMSGWT